MDLIERYLAQVAGVVRQVKRSSGSPQVTMGAS